METLQTVTGWYYIDIGTEIREAVLEALAPFMSEMRSAMAHLESNLTRISENVSRISTELEQVKRQTTLVVPGLVPHMNDIKREIDESTNSLAAEFQREISSLNLSIADRFLRQLKANELKMESVNSTMCRKVSEIESKSRNTVTRLRQNWLIYKLLFSFSCSTLQLMPWLTQL